MVFKRHKSAAAAELLQKETNLHFVNPFTFEIDLETFTKCLCEKDENADFELSCNFLDDSSYSDNQLLSSFKHFSDADNESSSPAHISKNSKKRKVAILDLAPITLLIITIVALKLKTDGLLGSCFVLKIPARTTTVGLKILDADLDSRITNTKKH